MPKEILHQISLVEEKADEMIRQANILAKKTVNDAVNEAFNIRERAVIESEAEYSKILMRHKKEALKEASILEEKIQTQILELKQYANNELESIADIIVERILQIDVNR